MMLCRVSQAVLDLLTSTSSSKSPPSLVAGIDGQRKGEEEAGWGSEKETGEEKVSTDPKPKGKGETGGRLGAGKFEEGREGERDRSERHLSQEELIQHSYDDLRMLEFEYVVDKTGKQDRWRY